VRVVAPERIDLAVNDGADLVHVSAGHRAFRGEARRREKQAERKQKGVHPVRPRSTCSSRMRSASTL
jgi:hypothetical protein